MEAEIPSSAERKLNVPPTLLRCSAVASMRHADGWVECRRRALYRFYRFLNLVYPRDGGALLFFQLIDALQRLLQLLLHAFDQRAQRFKLGILRQTTLRKK